MKVRKQGLKMKAQNSGLGVELPTKNIKSPLGRPIKLIGFGRRILPKCMCWFARLLCEVRMGLKCGRKIETNRMQFLYTPSSQHNAKAWLQNCSKIR